MVNCKISVAIASYNGGEYLKDQLESIYAQSLLPDEIVICDDCSVDNTIDILVHYKEKHGLKYFINDKNLGFVKNFEKAISLCSGEYIALSDQDDVWMSGKIEALYNGMVTEENKNPDLPILVHHDVFVVDENLKNTRTRFINSKGSSSGLKNLLFGNPKVQGASIMMNRALKEICFPLPDSVPLHDLYISFVTECFGVRRYISEPLSLYRQHTNNQIGINSFSVLKRVRNYFKKQIVIADESEKITLLIFENKFKEKLCDSDKEIIRDYFQVVDKEISLTFKISKVLKNGFNSNGSVFKLILKIANSNSKRMV
jgi:glycosyltransferase involved in cell wall biosynthesis